MAKLEDIKVGSIVMGIVANEPVTVTEVTKYGNNGISLKYRANNGHIYYQMLFPDSQESIEILAEPQPADSDRHAEESDIRLSAITQGGL